MTIPSHLTTAMPKPIRLAIDGRGETTAWDSGPTASEKTLVLLHGWNVDTTLNFGGAIGPLAQHYRVVATDLHGHGVGHRSAAPFRIEDCARDVIAVADHLGVDRFTPIGYSLGGAIAQVLARDFPERCDGLVLAATSARFNESRVERGQFAVVSGAAAGLRRSGPERAVVAKDRVFRSIVRAASVRYPPWVKDIVLQGDMSALLDAGAELGRFDSHDWLPQLEMPVAIVATTGDRVVDPARQRRLTELVAHALLIELDSDHDAPIRGNPQYPEVLLEAAHHATNRRIRAA